MYGVRGRANRSQNRWTCGSLSERERQSGDSQFGPLESDLEDIEKLFLLLMHRSGPIQLSLQGEAGQRLGQAQQSLTPGQLHELDLDGVAIGHELIVIRTRRIATCDQDSPEILPRTVRALGKPRVRMHLR
jgi:hypothetical protein